MLELCTNFNKSVQLQVTMSDKTNNRKVGNGKTTQQMSCGLLCLPKVLGSLISIFVAVSLLCGGSSTLTSCSHNTDSVSADTIDTTFVVGDDSINLSAEEAHFNKMEIKEVTKATFDKKANKYNYRVKVRFAPPGSTVTYEILMPFEDKIVAKSEDGRFSDLEPSPDNDGGGCYRVRAIAKRDGKTVATAMRDCTGFIKQRAVSKKLSVAQVQKLVDKRDNSLLGVGENDFFAPNYKMTFTGLDYDDENLAVMQDVFDHVDLGMWKSVTVTGLKYDEMNRVCEIQLHVKQ